jgi:glycosyltransferase involved in cell wall biosynthesis
MVKNASEAASAQVASDASAAPEVPVAPKTAAVPETPVDGLVSVILPVYNAAEHMCSCLDSICSQTYTNIEIICIDDGSTDASLDLLKDYETRDSRFRLYTQENSGAGATRNRGLALARGSHLLFLDADDLFEPHMIASAHRAIERHNADFCLFGSDQFETDSKRRSPGPLTVNKSLLPSDLTSFSFRDIKEDHFRSMLGWAWDKLFRTSFVRKNNLHFLEQHNSEDLYFVFNALLKAQRITVITKSMVHQRLGDESSLSMSRASAPFDFYYSLLALENDLKTMGLYEELERSFVTYALHYALWNLRTLPGQAFEELYFMLKEEGFAKLGIVGRSQEYFFEQADFVTYQKIIENEPIDFLQSELNWLRNQLKWLIRKVPLGLGLKAASWYQRRLKK